MRVLYLHQYFVDSAGAGGTRSLEFGRRLARNGHHVTLVTSTAMMSEQYRRQVRTSAYMIDGIHVVAIPVSYDNSMGGLRRVAAFLQFAVRSLVAVLRLPRQDVIVATSTPLTIAIPAAVARLRRRCRLVFEVRDLWPEIPIEMGYLQSPPLRWAARALERFAYGIADEIIALSPGMAEGVRRVVGNRKRLTVVPNSSDLERFSIAQGRPDWWPDLSPEARVVLYAGTLGKANDVGWIVRVLTSEHAPDDLHVVVVGGGADAAAISDLAERTGQLGRRIHVHGPVPKDEIVGAHRATHACLSLFADVHSLETTSPNKLFDALAAGRPVFINYGGWQEDLLAEHDCGARISRDPDDAARSLSNILFDQRRLLEMSNNARVAADRFSRDRLYQRWAEVVVPLGGRDTSESGLTKTRTERRPHH